MKQNTVYQRAHTGGKVLELQGERKDMMKTLNNMHNPLCTRRCATLNQRHNDVDSTSQQRRVHNGNIYNYQKHIKGILNMKLIGF